MRTLLAMVVTVVTTKAPLTLATNKQPPPGGRSPTPQCGPVTNPLGPINNSPPLSQAAFLLGWEVYHTLLKRAILIGSLHLKCRSRLTLNWTAMIDLLGTVWSPLPHYRTLNLPWEKTRTILVHCVCVCGWGDHIESVYRTIFEEAGCVQHDNRSCFRAVCSAYLIIAYFFPPPSPLCRPSLHWAVPSVQRGAYSWPSPATTALGWPEITTG